MVPKQYGFQPFGEGLDVQVQHGKKKVVYNYGYGTYVYNRGHLELGSTDHFEGTEPVQFWVRPKPWWPINYYRSAIIIWGIDVFTE